jgi:hypothetical protein
MVRTSRDALWSIDRTASEADLDDISNRAVFAGHPRRLDADESHVRCSQHFLNLSKVIFDLTHQSRATNTLEFVSPVPSIDAAITSCYAQIIEHVSQFGCAEFGLEQIGHHFAFVHHVVIISLYRIVVNNVVFAQHDQDPP